MKNIFRHPWLILATYGVWFAIFSGIQEMISGSWLKSILALILGIITYIAIKDW